MRIAIASAVAALMFANLASAAEPIALRDIDSFHVGEDAGTDKQRTIIGFSPVRIDPNGDYEIEPIYALPQAENAVRGNIVGVTASGRTIFCFCGGASF
jgi:hypothetical protein